MRTSQLGPCWLPQQAPMPSTSGSSGCRSGSKRFRMIVSRPWSEPRTPDHGGRPVNEQPRDHQHQVVLEVLKVTKRFGAVTALRNVSLQLRAGEVLGLIGDNGAGKSTLVNIICGALRPDEGQIIVDGVERHFADPSEARAAGIETVFQ